MGSVYASVVGLVVAIMHYGLVLVAIMHYGLVVVTIMQSCDVTDSSDYWVFMQQKVF